MAKLIAVVYGQALYELAVESNKVDAYLEEVKALKEAFTDGDDFLSFMKHPQVTKEEKQRVVDSSLKDKVSEELLNFLNIIIQKDRFADIVDIFDYYIDEVKELKGIGTAYVTTPMALSEIQKSNVKEKLLKTTKYNELEMEYTIDESLIGGMIIRIRDRIIDSSIKSSLEKLKTDLSKIQLQNI